MVRTLMLAAAVFAVAAPAAQNAPAAGAEAALLADGWNRLAKGDAAGAAQAAAQALLQNPLSAAALVLAVDADLIRGRWTGGLDAYERWLKGRTLDDGYVLRRVALAALREWSSKQPNVTARLEALRALAADGDADAAAALEQAASAGRLGETRALARAGNARAVNMLISQLGSMPGDRSAIINALADSGSQLAVAPLSKQLSDASDVNRAAAADGLGRLGAREAIPQLRGLLKDPLPHVRIKAAGALFRLDDSSGLPLLTDLTQSEHASMRLAAARELSSQPDASWQALVKALAGDPDPVVRVEAAKMIAPYDHQLAKRVLDAAMRDDNIAIREAAAGVFVERVAADFASLRALMRSGDPLVRVRSAARILELTR